MKKYFDRFLRGLGSMVLFMLVLSAIQAWLSRPTLPDRMILTYDINNGFEADKDLPPIQRVLAGGQTDIHNIGRALIRAKRDDRVAGFIIRISGGQSITLTQAQELRNYLADFKSSGKFTAIFADSYGDLGGGLASYYLAAAFDDIWLQPMGNVAINGASMKSVYAETLLDDLGIKPAFLKRGEFKSTPDSLARENMADNQRQMLDQLLSDVLDDFITGVAEDRQLSPNTIRKLIDRSPLLEQEAAEAGLIDYVDYSGAMMASAQEKAEAFFAQQNEKDQGTNNNDNGSEDSPAEGQQTSVSDNFDHPVMAAGAIGAQADFPPGPEDLISSVDQLADRFGWAGSVKDQEKAAEIVSINYYSQLVRIPDKVETADFAHIKIDGPIMRGISPPSLQGSSTAGANTIASAIEDAAKNPSIKGMIIRINSPGGSPVASETIRHAIIKTREVAEIPVIISLGEVAASGGYWVATGGDKIVSLPASITGSIGVFAGKLVVKDGLQKLGVNIDGVSKGENADIWSPADDFDTEGRQRINAVLDHTYQNFLSRVRKARGLTDDQLQQATEGRVFAGRRSLEVGLVDAIGGMEKATNLAKELADIDPATQIVFRTYPKPASAVERLAGLVKQLRTGAMTLADIRMMTNMVIHGASTNPQALYTGASYVQ
jgi:protease-4